MTRETLRNVTLEAIGSRVLSAKVAPVGSAPDADGALLAGSIRVRHSAADAGEVAHDEGHQVAGHRRRHLVAVHGQPITCSFAGGLRHIEERCLPAGRRQRQVPSCLQHNGAIS